MHTSYKVLTIDILTSSDNKNSTVYPGLLKAGLCHFSKKLFLLMQVGTQYVSRSISLPLQSCILQIISLYFFLYNSSYREKNYFNL